MPIEIKELHIRVAVNTPQGSSSPAAGGGGKTSGGGADEKDAIVAECVEQVLHILKNKRDR